MEELTKKHRILIAAAELFSQHGFDGTSIADIATQADVTHSLIFHYFGNKEKLWVAVKQHISQQADETVGILPSTDLPFGDFLDELCRRSLAFYEQNPHLVRMINWQRLEPQKHRAIGITNSPALQKWVAALSVYQERGDIPKQYKLEYVSMFILSIVSSIELDPNVYISTQADKQAYLDFCMKALRKVFYTQS